MNNLDIKELNQITISFNPDDPRIAGLILEMKTLQNQKVLRIVEEAEQNVFVSFLTELFYNYDVKYLNDVIFIVNKLGKELPDAFLKHYSPLSFTNEDFSLTVFDTFLEENRKSMLDITLIIENPIDNKKTLEVNFNIKKNGFFMFSSDDDYGQFDMQIDLFSENKINEEYFKSLSSQSQSSFKKIVISAFQKLAQQFE